jgi:hypothetical protein
VALQQAELLLAHASLRTYRGPGMLAATFAMAMARAEKRWLNFKTHSAAKTTSSNHFAHKSFLRVRRGIINSKVAPHTTITLGF